MSSAILAAVDGDLRKLTPEVRHAVLEELRAQESGTRDGGERDAERGRKPEAIRNEGGLPSTSTSSSGVYGNPPPLPPPLPPAMPKIVSPGTLPPHLFEAYRDVIMAQLPPPPSPLPFSPDLLGARAAMEQRLGVKLRARHADPSAMARAFQLRVRRQLDEAGGGSSEQQQQQSTNGFGRRGSEHSEGASAPASSLSADVRDRLDAMRQHHRARLLQLKQRLSREEGVRGGEGVGDHEAETTHPMRAAARRDAIRKARETYREHVRELRADARRRNEGRAREIEARRLERESAAVVAPSWILPNGGGNGAAAATASLDATSGQQYPQQPRSRFSVAPPATAASLSSAALQRMQIRRAPHMWMDSVGVEGGAEQAGDAEAREWLFDSAPTSAADGVRGLKSLVEALHTDDPRALYADMVRHRIRNHQPGLHQHPSLHPHPSLHAHPSLYQHPSLHPHHSLHQHPSLPGQSYGGGGGTTQPLPPRLAPRMSSSSVPWVPATRRGELPRERAPAALRASDQAALRLRPRRPTPVQRHDPRTELFAAFGPRMPQIPLPPRAQPVFRSKHAAGPSFVIRPRRSCRCGAGSRWKQNT